MAGPKFCLGVHIGHDRGAALVKEGVLVAGVAEERLDRRKHSNSPDLPILSIHAVLNSLELSPQDLAGIGISYTNVRIAKIIDQLRDEIRDCLNAPDVPVLGVGHHDCHALSAYFTSGVDQALVMVADGAGDIVGADIEAESLYDGKGPRLSLVDQRLQSFGLTRTDRRNAYNPSYMHELDWEKQISLGRKYEQLTYLIGFRHGESGKTMGLAAYADPLFRLPLPKIDGLQFSLRFADGLEQIERCSIRSREPWHRFIRNQASAIAAASQTLLEDFMVAVLCDVHRRSPRDVLCAAGGLFLNCKMNHEILKRTPFEHLHVFPAAGDDGQAIGAAFHVHNELFGGRRVGGIRHMFLGPKHSIDEIEERIGYFGLSAKRLDEKWLIQRLVDDLVSGNFVGVLRGRSEIGPRALGHRSILADPRRDGVKDCLNRLKGRELFRPFAPIIPSEDQFRYFDLVQDSPFMLLAGHLKTEFRSALPAIVHADGSSRVQAVEASEHPFLHALLKEFESRTGHPVLLNTSFNLAGEPIVQSPHDAITTFLASDLDVLVLEDFYVTEKWRRL